MPTHIPEGDETLPVFVPQYEAHTPEALKQGQPADTVEVRVIAQHEREPVTRDSTVQMMNVMNANIGGEPAQQAWQRVVRAAVKGDLLPVPGAFVSPHGMFELVLHIEHPDADRSSEQHDWKMHEHELADADQPHHHGDECCDGGIGRHGAEPGHPTLSHEPYR